MAQFTAQRRLFNVEGISSGLEPKDPCHYKLGGRGGGGRRSTRTCSIHRHKRRPRLNVSTRVSFSTLNQSNHFYAEACYDNYDDFSEIERDELACFRGLVLDISYRPINVVCWKRAICLEFMEKADVLEYYDQTVNSPRGSFYIPAVLRVPHLLQVVKRRRIKNSLSRKHIFFRDSFTCQYCSSHENLTIDHVLPSARGGQWKWENLVTACSECNSKKGQKTVEEAKMKLVKLPKAPKEYDIVAIPLTSSAIRMLRMRKGTPEEWRQYLSKPSSEP